MSAMGRKPECPGGGSELWENPRPNLLRRWHRIEALRTGAMPRQGAFKCIDQVFACEGLRYCRREGMLPRNCIEQGVGQPHKGNTIVRQPVGNDGSPALQLQIHDCAVDWTTIVQ